MLEKHTPASGLNAICKLAYVKHSALEGSMEVNPGWFEAAITYTQPVKLLFDSWLPGPVPGLCPLLLQVRADLMGFILLLFLDPCPSELI